MASPQPMSPAPTWRSLSARRGALRAGPLALPGAADAALASLSRRAITHVIAQGLNGGLPTFTATLGLTPVQLAVLSDVLVLDAVLVRQALAVGETEPDTPYRALQDLLWQHRRRVTVVAWAVAAAIAGASFGRQHLWQDLGLDGRADVTQLLEQHFPTLAARNVHQLKWKRFLYAELGQQLGQPGLRPPHCGGCDQHSLCFGADR